MLSAATLGGSAAIIAALACGGTVVDPATRIVALHVRASGTDVPFVMNVGVEVPLEAIPIGADSVFVGAPVSATWRSSDTVVATVNARGVAHSSCIATTVITASSEIAGKLVAGGRLITVATTGPACVGR